MLASPPIKHGEFGVDSEEDDSQIDMTEEYTEKEQLLPQEWKDIEAQPILLSPDAPPSPTAPAEYRVPARTKYLYLALYFGLNLTLTLFNKAVLGKVCPFRSTVFPCLAC